MTTLSYPQNQAMQPVYTNAVQPVPVKPLPSRVNNECKVETIVHYLLNPQINNGKYLLCKNQLGAKFIIKNRELIPWSETRLINLVKADAFFNGQQQLTDNQIKLAFQIISGKEEIWPFDSEEDRTMPFRSVTASGGGFAYRLNQNHWCITNNFYPQVKAYIPNGMKEIPSPPLPDALYRPLDLDYINSAGFHRLKDLVCKGANLPEEFILLILAWLIQAMTSDNYTLLELTGESNVGKSLAQSILRGIVDPHVELMTKIPKKLVDFERMVMDGHVMSFDNVDTLTDDVQSFMIDLLSEEGVKISHSTVKNECKNECFIHHPIILNALMPVVTNEKLQSKTLSIEMKPQKAEARAFGVDQTLIYDVRIELLRLAKLMHVHESVFHHVIPRCTYRDLKNFAEIGLKLSIIIYRNTSEFKKQFALLIKEQTQAKLEENQAGYLMYLWANENPNTETVLSASDWINLLSDYHDSSFGEWKVSPRQLGVDLKRAAPVLRQFGIECKSLGKLGSFVKWAVITPAKVELQGGFFEATNNSLQSNIKEQSEPQPQESSVDLDAVNQDDQSNTSSIEGVQDTSSANQESVRDRSKVVTVEVRKALNIKRPETQSDL